MIGRFSVISELGEGGMATVYRAYDPSFKREVAIKVLPQQRSEEGSYRQRFEREARTIANLEHNAIVPVYEFGDQDGQPFLVMRLMTGGSLADRLQKSTISPSEISSILQRMGSALDKAHQNGIVHRDLKPANILFDDGGGSYLSDFGIVKVAEESTLTAVGQVVGTPAYMSPEQVLGQADIDGRADIYALGAILYEMLTGQLPYQATTTMGMAMMHINNPIPTLRDIDPNMPAGYQAVIARAMAKDREDRYHSGAELAADFANASKDSLGVIPLAVGATVVESASWQTDSTEILADAYPPTPPPPLPAAAVGGTSSEGLNWKVIGGAFLSVGALAVLLFFIFYWFGPQRLSEPENPTIQALELTMTSQESLIATVGSGAAENAAGATLRGTNVAGGDGSADGPVENEGASENTNDGGAGAIDEDGERRLGTEAEPLPSSTAIPTDTPAPTDTPFPTDTPYPTNTPFPTNTPIPAATFTPVPVACSVAVHGPFTDIWEAQQAQLGCASSGAAGSNMAEENFAGGRMIWREDNDKIYAIYNSGAWASYDDLWYEGDPSFSCGTEQSPPTPQRGFGKIWCTYGAVQSGLGNATNSEYATSGTIQHFANGFIMQVGSGQARTYYYGGSWR